MSVQAIIAAVVFVGLFLAWVVLPTQVKKHHTTEDE